MIERILVFKYLVKIKIKIKYHPKKVRTIYDKEQINAPVSQAKKTLIIQLIKTKLYEIIFHVYCSVGVA
jgi:hypothetical protein